MNKLHGFLRGRLGTLLVILVELAIGVLLLIDAVAFTEKIIMVFGIGLILASVLFFIRYFRAPAVISPEKRYLSRALIALLGGVFCLFGYSSVMAAFPMLTVLYGVILLVHMLFRVQDTVDMIRLHHSVWKLSAVLTGLTLILAVLILVNPFASESAVWILTGISYIVSAVMQTVLLCLMPRRKAAKADKAEEPEETPPEKPAALPGEAAEKPGEAAEKPAEIPPEAEKE